MTIELHRQLFSKGHKAPVIFIRHTGAERTDRRKSSSGVVAYLERTFHASALLYAIPKSG